MQIRRLSAYILILALAACATGGGKYGKTISMAEKEVMTADKAGALWTDTENLIAEAKRAYDAGDRDRANALAKQAMDEAKQAQKQAKDNAKAAPHYPQR